MISNAAFRKLALSFEETSEAPHFDKTAFRVKKKIFVTFDEKARRITVKLSAVDQSTFCLFNKTIIYPVPNKWGTHGWTHVELKTVPREMLTDILTTAYCEAAPKDLAAKYRGEE
jgi:hypothetical protein